jgi:hypothetical protein
MGKGAKIQVSEYYMSQHFGVCTTVDAIRKASSSRRSWPGHGYVTAQTSWRIKEEDLFGGNKKEGGAVGTIYFLPGATIRCCPTSSRPGSAGPMARTRRAIAA